MKKLLYIYEFADKANLAIEKKADTLWAFSQKKLEELNQNVKVETAYGFFGDRRENGLALRRFFNFLYMHVLAPFEILFSRADVVFVRTTPPLMQISYAFWATLFCRKKIFWLMDYHPVFGVRTTKSGSIMNRIWRFFDAIDKFFLKKFDLVVCIDEAMQELINERAPNVKTIVCPTFSLKNVEWLDLKKEANTDEPLRLLYSGNLGKSHSTKRLELLLKNLVSQKKVEFSYCGSNQNAVEILKKMCERCGANFKHHGFIEKYEDLGKFYQKEKFDFGVVLLNDELKGIVSPSKFSGYTAFGLPIIYLGPELTNADMACKKFGAGLAAETEDEVLSLTSGILSNEIRNECARATKNTIEYFSPKSADILAEEFDKFFTNLK